MHLRTCLVTLAILGSACSATSGGGGGGAVAFTAGGACAATYVTDQCGVTTGKAAVVHCTGGVWTVVKACGASETCAVKTVPTCVASASGADATSGDDGLVFDAITTPTDVKSGTDTLIVDDMYIAPDVQKDIGKDIGKDTTKPKDTGPAAATWGTCGISDTACLQSCVQSSCATPGQACAGDSGCAAFQQCNQGCGATPIQMPSGASSIPQNAGESQQDYCYRVCQAQAGPSAVALDQAYLECVIGLCVDCGSSAASGLTQAQCQAACGTENYCTNEYNACVNDTDCLAAYGCVLTASDQTAQQACLTNAAGNAASLFQTMNTCVGDHATQCSAP